jgi:hypothetical protein
MSVLSSTVVPERGLLVAGDRAIALERGFETAWYWADDTRSFSDALGSLWGDGSALHVPSLFLNCTDAITGKRLVLSNVSLGADNAERRDLGELLGGRHLRLSTAVLLSARFPVISPGGWLRERPGLPGSGSLVVDGGYVDNSGTLTASEVIDAIHAVIVSESPKFDHVQLVALMIANDPIPQSQPVLPTFIPSGTTTSIVGSLLVPIETLDALRQVQTIKLKRDYIGHVRDIGGTVFDEFLLHTGDAEFPLGWTLSGASMEAMDMQIAAMADRPASHFSQTLSILSKSR